MPVFELSSSMPVPASEVYTWHTRPGAFSRLNPVWQAAEVAGQVGPFESRAVKLKLPFGPLKLTWLAQHSDAVEGKSFRDTQVAGPFNRWVHDHLMTPGPGGSSVLTDRIAYELPLGWLGRMMMGKSVGRDLDTVFNYRHKITGRDLGRHAATPQRLRGCKVAITGASGLLGRVLSAFFSAGGHEVVRIGRGQGNDLVWDPTRDDLGLAPDALDGVVWVIHLAGDNVGAGRWNEDKKKAMYESRVPVTRRLATFLARMRKKPQVLVCASGIGVFGDRGDEFLDETSKPGPGFFGDLCQAWEGAAAQARQEGIRCVEARMSMVLSPLGGALEKMLPIFKMGLGGPLGSGKQYWSWVSLEDVIGLMHHACITESVEGPVHVTSPEPMTCKEFVRELGHVLGRPAVLPAPSAVLKVMMGESAGPLVLASVRAVPERALTSGYQFVHPGLRDALREMLGR
jgi:uncharacterized protein